MSTTKVSAENKLPVIPFAKPWSKLEDRMFSTVRKDKPPYNEYKVGQIFRIKGHGDKFDFDFEATLLALFSCKANMLPDEFWMMDTDTASREEAFKEVNQFYPKNKITEETIVRVLILGHKRRY